MTIQVARVLIVASGVVAATACGVRSTEEAEKLLGKQYSDQFQTATFSCAAGQAEYDYICSARYEPKPGSTGRVIVRRVGARFIGTVGFGPQGTLTVLPDEGAVPSMEALAAQRKAEAQQAADRAAARAKAALGGRGQ